MTFEEILKGEGIEDDVISTISDKLKANSIYFANEENLNIRYKKLKEDNNTINEQYAQAQKLIDELKAQNSGDEELQGKVADYETQIKVLQDKLNQTQIDNALNVALMNAKAKDPDYLAFKIKSGGALTLDDNGKIKGIDETIKTLKTEHPLQFANESRKEISVNKLPDNPETENKISQETFNKMGYQSRLKLYNDNPELYKELKGENK